MVGKACVRLRYCRRWRHRTGALGRSRGCDSPGTARNPCARRRHLPKIRWTMNQIRLLAIGHSYVLAVNRATLREVARDTSFDITVAAPSFFHGDLRPVHCEPEPPDSPLKLVSIPARWTRHIHVFHYAERALRDLIVQQPFDGIHAWEEPY